MISVTGHRSAVKMRSFFLFVAISAIGVFGAPDTRQPISQGELCYLGDLQTYVNGGICAPGSHCMSVGDAGVKDMFCGHYNIDIGGACGTTAAEVMRI